MKKLTIITTTIAFVIAGLAVYIKKMKLFKKDKS
jgi:hypothetical protein